MADDILLLVAMENDDIPPMLVVSALPEVVCGTTLD